MSTEPSRPDDFASLYRRRFQEHSARTLSSTRRLKAPTPVDALSAGGAIDSSEVGRDGGQVVPVGRLLAPTSR
jgi:hypothetical protein